MEQIVFDFQIHYYLTLDRLIFIGSSNVLERKGRGKYTWNVPHIYYESNKVLDFIILYCLWLYRLILLSLGSSNSILEGKEEVNIPETSLSNSWRWGGGIIFVAITGPLLNIRIHFQNPLKGGGNCGEIWNNG